MKFAKYLIAASMLAVAGSAAATTVNFTDEESPGVTCCGLMASNAYAAYGLTVNDAYWYRDGRDTFDQEGISIYNAPTATIIFNSGTNGVSFQYDANGNTIEKSDNGAVQNYIYNEEDRLTETSTRIFLRGRRSLPDEAVFWHNQGLLHPAKYAEFAMTVGDQLS